MYMFNGQEDLIFDRAGCQAIDAEAIRKYGIPGIALMEHASLNAARAILDLIAQPPPEVAVVCGSGNNGGDGYAIARHLHNSGIGVSIIAVLETRPGSDAETNRQVVERMGLKVVDAGESKAAGLLVDAVFGTGLDREVEGRPRDVIAWMNAQDAPIVAIDVPSGLDCDRGCPLGSAVRAEHTVTFLGPKVGFLQPGADQWTGQVHVVQIGAPIDLLREHALPQSD